MMRDSTSSSRRISVLYGSQTGTAEEVAERIARECRRRRVRARVSSLDDYPVGELPHEDVVVFSVATHGQGDPPDNMKKFWRFLLRRNLPADSLAGVNVAVIGLGDSTYTKFNFIAKKLQRRLVQLGATRLVDVGCADEQHAAGQDAVLDPWIADFGECLLEVYPLPPGVYVVPKNVRPSPKFNISIVTASPSTNEDASETTCGDQHAPFSQENPFCSKVLSTDRVTADNHFQDVRLIRFDLRGSTICFSPGDVLVVQPRNIHRKVSEFLSVLGWDGDSCITIEQSNEDDPLPEKLPRQCSLYQLFHEYFDIQAIPRRYFFELLAHFTPSDLERERLEEFCSADGQEDLFDYCYRLRRTYTEVLQDFPEAAASVDIRYIFDLFPPLRARSFSIASCLDTAPECAEILMAVVKYRTKMLNPREGVCSTWLASILPDSSPKIDVWTTSGTIAFPSDPSVPVIMVGPGTGCAPFRSFIQHRVATNCNGELALFFGSRSRHGDFFFADEWSELVVSGKLQLFTAFSRDQEHKIYVQHVIKEQADYLWRLIDQEGAYFFLAGNSKDMPTGVTDALKEIFSSNGGMDVEAADEYFKDLEMTRRFQCETWA